MISYNEFDPSDLALKKQDNKTYLIRYKGKELTMDVKSVPGFAQIHDCYPKYNAIVSMIYSRIYALGFDCEYPNSILEKEDEYAVKFTSLMLNDDVWTLELEICVKEDV